MSRKYQINDEEWNQIVSRAFSPDMPEPKFSKSYYQRRQEQERKIAMKHSRKSERRNRAGFAVMTACVAGMSGLAIYSGVNIYQVGRTAQQNESMSEFHVGSENLAVNEEATEIAPDFQSLKSYGETSDEAFSFELCFTCQEDEHTSNGGYYDIKSDWLPEDKTAFVSKFQRVADVTKDFYKKFDHVLSYQAFQTSSGNDAYYLILDGMLQLYVHFSGTPYIASYYINDLSMTGEEIQKLADNLYLEVSDTETAVLWTPESQEYTIEDMPYVQRIEFQCEENDYTANGGCYDLQLNWLPDGLELAGENSPYCGKYHNFSDESDEHAMTPSFCRVKDVSKNFVTDVDYAVDRLEMELDSGEFKKQMVLITRDRGYARLYVHFEGTPYVADYYINGFTQEEAIQLADNMTLVETEEETAGIYQEAWTIDKQYADPSVISELITAEKNGISESDSYGTEMTIDMSQLNLVHVGDTVNKSELWIDEVPVENPDIQLTINDATLQNDFTGITTDCIGLPQDFSQYLNENGELYVNKTVTKVGNGLTSIDELLEESVVKQYILKLDMTLTRTGKGFEVDDEEYYDDHGICFNMPLMSIVDNQIQCWDYIGNSLSVGYEPNFKASGFFSFYTEHEHEKNGIYDLEVGESADCVFYYAVDEEQIGNLYISLFDTSDFTTGSVLDLCDLPAPETSESVSGN